MQDLLNAHFFFQIHNLIENCWKQKHYNGTVNFHLQEIIQSRKVQHN